MTPYSYDNDSLLWVDDLQGGEGFLPSDETLEAVILHVAGSLLGGCVAQFQDLLSRLNPDRMHRVVFEFLLEGASRHGVSLPSWEARRRREARRRLAVLRRRRRHLHVE